MIGRYYEEIEIDRAKYISNVTVDLTEEAVKFRVNKSIR